MTPKQIAKNSESSHQKALMCWANMAYNFGAKAADDESCYKHKGYAERTYGRANAIHDLKWLHHIPNGGARGDTRKSAMIHGAQLKAEGVKKGVWDLFLPVPDNPVGSIMISGLYIEMKRGNNPLTKEQKEFQKDLPWFDFIVCKSWLDGRKALINYLGVNDD